jgi:hypothetical protein
MDKELTPDAPKTLALTTEEKLEMATELLAAYDTFCLAIIPHTYTEGKPGSSLRERYKVFLSHVQEEPEREVIENSLQ